MAAGIHSTPRLSRSVYPVDSQSRVGTTCHRGVSKVSVACRPLVLKSIVVRASNQAATQTQRSWSTEDSAAFYKVEGWGASYFAVNEKGHVVVSPDASDDGAETIDLFELVDSLKRRNVQLPMVIRFPDIIQNRMQELQNCFDAAIARFGCEGAFQGVFPVKCNQDRRLLEDIVEYGRPIKFGLEAGSKPELLIAMSQLKDNDGAILVCNGYKDQEYIENALVARKLGLNSVIVLEQMQELPLVLEASKRLDARPLIGVRAKLSTRHDGHWGETSGDRAKFGLSVNEIVRVVKILREHEMLDCLQLLHFHIGSQIPSISLIKEAMREGSHLYCELALMGAKMGFIDVGGGLGIDYDGSRSSSVASTNYTMQNYANDVVAAVVDACLLKGVKQPIILTESGRALASHQSVLVFDVLSANIFNESHALQNFQMLGPDSADQVVPPEQFTGGDKPKPRKARHGRLENGAGTYLLRTFHEVLETMDETNFQEAYHDAKQFKAEATALFKLGCLTLEQRAQADSLYQVICHEVLRFARETGEMADDAETLRRSFAAIYHVNLSVFRSVPDSWAISQVFPIMPIHRLDEEPAVQATLADLTCDSDGKIDHFPGYPNATGKVIAVHELEEDRPYYLGLFLAGTYQEVMGSSHNLFGTTNVVYVRARPKSSNKACNGVQSKPIGKLIFHRGGYSIEHVVPGQTTDQVLRTVQHDADDMMEDLRNKAEEAVAEGNLSLEEAQTLLHNLKKTMHSYTYLSS
ncbi:unnamed protein product [Closterium sp. NIES-65]|nr:unnamed protein product [Closterium sp. NIES-65]